MPQGCIFLKLPGRGGGLATVFKDSYLCRSLSTGTHSCFEVLLFQLSLVNPVFFAFIYRPPNINKEFLNEFAQFMSEIVTSYDRILILGDFSIHVCCDSKPLSKDFLRLLDSFGFVQRVSGPTHAQGHTLDLILSRGMSVLDIKIDLLILFSVSLDGNTPSQSSLPCRTCIFLSICYHWIPSNAHPLHCVSRIMYNLLHLMRYYCVYICVHNVECVHTVYNVY